MCGEFLKVMQSSWLLRCKLIRSGPFQLFITIISIIHSRPFELFRQDRIKYLSSSLPPSSISVLAIFRSPPFRLTYDEREEHCQLFWYYQMGSFTHPSTKICNSWTPCHKKIHVECLGPQVEVRAMYFVRNSQFAMYLGR